MASSETHCDLFLSFVQLQMVSCTQLPLLYVSEPKNSVPSDKISNVSKVSKVREQVRKESIRNTLVGH